MDMMDTVGVQLTSSTNASNNHVTFEGVRDGLIAYNTFTGAAQIDVHPNEEYVLQHYTQSKGYTLGAVTMPSDNIVTMQHPRTGARIIVMDFTPPVRRHASRNSLLQSGGKNYAAQRRNFPVSPV